MLGGTSFAHAIKGLGSLSLLLTAACFTGDPPTALIVHNESESDVVALVNRDGGTQGSSNETPAMSTGYISWPRCDTKWLIISRQSDGQEFYRGSLELCPGDRLVIGADFSAVTHCDHESLKSRPDEC